MAKPEWGIKRICHACGTRYYDLERSPILCPSCGAEFDPEAFLKSRRSRPIDSDDTKPSKSKAGPVEEPAEDEDEAADEVEETTGDDEDVIDADMSDSGDDDDAPSVKSPEGIDDDSLDDDFDDDSDDDALLEDDDLGDDGVDLPTEAGNGDDDRNS